MEGRHSGRSAGLRRKVAPLLTLAFLVPAAGGRAGEDEATRSRMEERARAHLAQRLEVAAEAIRVVTAEARTWPDERLGCSSRRLLGDPLPVAGYLFVLETANGRFEYHTDRESRVLPCDRPKKPLDRIE